MTSHIIELKEGERIVAEVRRHIFVFWMRAGGALLAALVPLAFAAPLSALFERAAAGHGGTLFLVAYLLWFLAAWVVFFFRWTDYYLDVWVITNERVFDIEQRGAFHRDISVFRLQHIQDITVEIRGALATFFKYGDLHIHTASENVDLVIKDAADPLAVKKIIMDATASVRATSPAG